MKNKNEFYNTEIKQKFLNEKKGDKDIELYRCLFHTTIQFEESFSIDLAKFNDEQYKILFDKNNWLTGPTFKNKKQIIDNYAKWYYANIDATNESKYISLIPAYSEIAAYIDMQRSYYQDILDLMQNVRDVFSNSSFDNGYILSVTVLVGLMYYNIGFDDINTLTKENFLIPDTIYINKDKIVNVHSVFYNACLKMFDFTTIKARTTKYLQSTPYLIRRSYSSPDMAKKDNNAPDSKFMYNNRRKIWKSLFENMNGYVKGSMITKASLAYSGAFASVYEKGLNDKTEINRYLRKYFDALNCDAITQTYFEWRKYFYNL